MTVKFVGTHKKITKMSKIVSITWIIHNVIRDQFVVVYYIEQFEPLLIIPINTVVAVSKLLLPSRSVEKFKTSIKFRHSSKQNSVNSKKNLIVDWNISEDHLELSGSIFCNYYYTNKIEELS